MKKEIVVDGIVKFIEAEILPSLDEPKRWAAAFGVGVIHSQSSALIDNLLIKYPYITMLGIADANGDIDVDALLGIAKETIRKQGALDLNVPFIGAFRLGEPAFDKLGEYIRNRK